MTLNTPTLSLEQAKHRAYAIKVRMTELGTPISLTHAYESLATGCGYRNWPTMQAALQAASSPGPVSRPTSERNRGLGTPEVRGRITDNLVERGLLDFKRKDGITKPKVETTEKGGTPFAADKLFDRAGLQLLQIFQICNGDYSDHHDVEWSHKEEEERFEAVLRHASSLKALLDQLDTPVFQPRRWHPVRIPPPAGGAYVIGGYVSDGILPRRFEWAFANVVLTVDGPEWSHWDEKRSRVPIEYWTALGPHPEHRKPEQPDMTLIEKDELQDIVMSLEEVRKAVFGDVGDCPDVYRDYDRLTELSGSMQKAVRKLHRRTFEPGATV